MKQLVDNKMKNRGISLIVLVITIIVAVILISAVLLSLDKNDPRKGASENVFKSDFRTLQEELAMKKTEMKQEDNKANINVNVSYDNEEELKKWINSIDKSILNGIVEICNGDLVFIDKGMSDEEKIWAKEIAAVVDSCDDYSPKRGGFYFKGSIGSQEIESYTWTNQDVSIRVDDTNAQDLKAKYNNYIYSIDSSDYMNYTSAFTISTASNTTRIAKIKGVAKSSSDSTLEPIDFVEDYVVKIDKIAPTAPNIITGKIGSEIQITLSGAQDADSGINSVYYSTDYGASWKKYDAAIMIEDNVKEVWSKARDNAGNETPSGKYGKVIVRTDTAVDVRVTSPDTNIYKAGSIINIEAIFTGQKPLAAPTLNINFGNGTTRTATAVNSSSNKIVYNYTIQDGDNGSLAIVNNRYYDRDVVLGGNRITADTIKPELSFVTGKYNGNSQNAVVTDTNDKVTIEFKATDLNINTSYLKAEDITLMLNGNEVNTLQKTLTTSTSGNTINFILTLTGFTSESGKVSIKVPERKINDKALTDYNWNDEKTIETNYTIETKIDKENPKVTSVEMTSNNTTGGEKFAKNSDVIKLKVKFSENLGTVPTILIAGRETTLVSSATGASEYTATMTIPSGETNLEEGYLGYTISGYKDLTGNLGDTVTKNTVTSKPVNINDTVLYDRTNPTADASFNYYYKSGGVINDVSNTNGYAYRVTLKEFNISDALSGINSKQYQWSTGTSTPTGNWTNIVGNQIPEQTTTGTYYLHIKVVDNSGNTFTTYKEVKIDRTAPVIPDIVVVSGTYSQNWYTSDVKVGFKDSASPSDHHSGVSSVNWSPSDLTLQQTGKASVTVVDNVGNMSSKSSETIMIDPSNPKLNVAVYKVTSGSTLTQIMAGDSPSYTYPYWVNTDIRVKVNVEGLGEGVSISSMKYQMNSSGNYSSYGNYNNAIDLNASASSWEQDIKDGGKRKIKFIATTTSGKTLETEVFVDIDKQEPTISFTLTMLSKSGSYLGSSGWGYYGKISTTISEAQSGVKSVQYSWTSSASIPSSGWTTATPKSNGGLTGVYTIDAGEKTTTGTYYLHVKVTDNAGNVKNEYKQVKIDRTSPTASLSVTYKNKSKDVIDTSKTNGYCYSAEYSASKSDSHSGVSKIQYKLNDGSWSNTAPTVPTTTGKNTLYVKAVDNVGNESAVVSKAINIDRKAPNFSFSWTKSVSKSTRTITLSGIGDKHSGVNTQKYEYYLASNVKTENNKGLRKVGLSNSSYKKLATTSKTSYAYSMTKGKLYSVKIRVYDKVGNYQEYNGINQDKLNFYGPCSHKFGTYKDQYSGNWKVEKYYFTERWKCSADGTYHSAGYDKYGIYRVCVNCKVPAAYLRWIGNETIDYTMWHPTYVNGYNIDTKSYNSSK